MKTILFALLLFSCASPKEEALIVGTNAEFAPFCFERDGDIVGFDIDVAEEVAKRLGKTIKIVDMPFDTLIPSLMLGKIHFIAAGMSPTEERAKKVLFSLPYLEGDPLIAVYKKGAVPSKEARYVVCLGYTSDTYATEVLNIDPLRLSCPLDAFMALRSGQADAFITSQMSAKPFLNEEWDYTVVRKEGEKTCLMISKHYPELQKEINCQLQKMKDEGAIDSLKAKWKLQ